MINKKFSDPILGLGSICKLCGEFLQPESVQYETLTFILWQKKRSHFSVCKIYFYFLYFVYQNLMFLSHLARAGCQTLITQ